MMNEEQIDERIHELLIRIEELRLVKGKIAHIKMGRPLGSTKYSEEQDSFLRECIKEKIPYRKITQEFNKQFGTNVKADSRQLYNYMERNGIIIPTPVLNPRKKKADKIVDEINSMVGK